PGAALAGAGAIILEVKHDRVLAGLERVAKDIAISHAALPAIPLEIEHVVGKHRLALEQIEAVSAEATAVSGDHSFGAALGNGNLGGDGVVLVEDARGVAVGNAGILSLEREDTS